MHNDISSFDSPYTVETKDHYSIHGLLNMPQNISLSSKKSKVVVLPVMQESELYSHMAQSQRKFFNKNGYDVLRVALSHTGQDARRFKDITLGHMASDIRQICTTLRGSYNEIFITSHGLTSFSVALSNADCDGQSLIEACFTPYETFVESGYAYRRELNLYQSLLSPMECLGARLVESCKLFDHQACRSMIQSIDKPTQFVWAGRGLGENVSALYKAYLNTHAQSVTIDGADHKFNASNTLEKALEQSMEWFSYCSHMYDITELGIFANAKELPTYAVN